VAELVDSVAIIGGGYAGCAAAVTLARKGVRCAIYETAPVLGGRARRVERDGFALDNGQHLLIGAYARTLEMLAQVHGENRRATFIRRPLSIAPFVADQRDALTLFAPRAPGRLGLLVGLLGARGLTWRERIANLNWFRAIERGGFDRPAGETVARLLSPLPPRVAKLLWEPLNLAALNTPASSASAQVFVNVLRGAFAGRGDDSDFILPATDLTAFLPDAAAHYVTAQGGQVHRSTRAQVVSTGRASSEILADGRAHAARAVIVAVGPHQLGDAFAREAIASHPPLAAAIDGMAAMSFEAIATIWLGYAARVPMPGPVARLDDAPGQWVLDRPDVLTHANDTRGVAQMLAVVISANGAHLTLSHEALVQAVDTQLRRLLPSMPACVWSFVIAEKRATYACTPRRPRPAGPRFAPGIYLAGDYVDDQFPATLEAAVRSGINAAEALASDLA
jgi:squalene-associated FAD-dependent desaturase